MQREAIREALTQGLAALRAAFVTQAGGERSAIALRSNEIQELFARFVVGLIVLLSGFGLSMSPLWWLRPFALPSWLLAFVFLMPGTAASVLLLLGFVRTASWLASSDGWNWGRDRRGARSVTLALGLLSSRMERQPEYRKLIEATLEVVQLGAGRVTPGVVLAEGIRSFLRGDREDARRLWRLTVEFDRSVLPPKVAALAAELLAAEAAERAQFDRMLRELARPRMPATGLTKLLADALARMRGAQITDGVLRLRWFFSGRWSATRPIVDRACAIAPSPPPAVPALDEPLQAALVASVRLGDASSVRRSAVCTAAVCWEAALSAPPLSERPTPELREQIVASLAERLEHAIDLPSEGEPEQGLFREVVWRCADQRDEHLRWLSTEIGQRTDQKRTVPLLEEVRAWCQMLEAYEDVLSVAPERAVSSFPRLYYPGVRQAVWLHNERGQATAANAMYRVMLRAAEAVGHEAGIALLRNNLACGP